MNVEIKEKKKELSIQTYDTQLYNKANRVILPINFQGTVWMYTVMIGQCFRFLSHDSKSAMTSLGLYKYLLRQCERLPPDACKHYKFAVKQSYKQHKFEPDPERVKEIISKSIEDAKWIVKKYTKK